MQVKLKLPQKLMILVSVPLICGLALFTGILATMLKQADVQVLEEQRSKALISQSKLLMLLMNDAALGIVGYCVSQNRMFLYRSQKAGREVTTCQTELRTLVASNPEGIKILNKVDSIVEDEFKILKQASQAVAGREHSDYPLASDLFTQLQASNFQLKNELDSLTADARKLKGSAQENAREDIFKALIAGSLINVIITILLTAYLSRSFGRRIQLLTDNAMLLAAGETLRPPAAGDDEIAKLDSVFHTMATSLAEATRKERATIENALDVICSINSSGRFASVSAAANTVWGYAPEDLVGRRYLDILPAQDSERVRELVEITIADRGTCTFETSVLKKDNQEVQMLWTARWSEIEKSLFCVAHDITERKRAENLIKASEERIRSIIKPAGGNSERHYCRYH